MTSPAPRTASLTALVSGLLFALGLGLAGMTDPQRVLAFLDVAGDAWDPSLALVLGGAVVTYGLGARKILAWPRPIAAPTFDLPRRRSLDLRLVGGAASFGVGWGLVGLCPGPALVDLVAAGADVCIFVAAMLAGMALFAALPRRP